VKYSGVKCGGFSKCSAIYPFVQFVVKPCTYKNQCNVFSVYTILSLFWGGVRILMTLK
jgi:hypothetical protein